MRDRDQGAYRFEEGRAGKGPRYALFLAAKAHVLYPHVGIEQHAHSESPDILLEDERLTGIAEPERTPAQPLPGFQALRGCGGRGLELGDGFFLIASAVLNRQRLKLTYWNRTKDEVTEREVSPQRLVHYRENWYLDAWCHLRNDLRSFALDAMRGVEMVAGKVKEVPDKELDEVLASGYGIFSGKKVQWATLRFTPERARYVAMEEWHPKQRARCDKDGHFTLELPYSSESELAMDILKFGPDLEVLAPIALRTHIMKRLNKSLDACNEQIKD